MECGIFYEKDLQMPKIYELKRGQLYSEELRIELKRNSDNEIFKWFLASILLGARITESIAKNTYKA